MKKTTTGVCMKALLIGFALTLVSQASIAFERPFRIDRYENNSHGYAVAWGIPGTSLNFEKLDTLSDLEIEKVLDFSSIRNYVVDLQTNEILTTIENGDMVIFNIGNIHYGNHYNLSIDKLAIQGTGYGIDSLAVIESYKWFNTIPKILLIDTNAVKLKTVEINAAETIKLLKDKLKQAILPINMDLYENGAENFTKIETIFLENNGEVNVISLDYEFPKQDKSALQVIVTVKLKYSNGKIIPYILGVKQNQYQ